MKQTMSVLKLWGKNSWNVVLGEDKYLILYHTEVSV